MTEETVYDVVVIGAGPGGYHSALRAAQYNAKVAIIEKSKLGGTCSNWGCIPTKALYASAKLLEDIREKAAEFGIEIPCDVQGNFAKAVERKNKVVSDLVSGIEGLLKTRKIDIFMGAGKIESGNAQDGFVVSSTAADGSKSTLKTRRVIVATGSTPALIPAFNIDHEKILTSDDILAPGFTQLPKKMLIIGAGVIGCEFANIFNQFGVEVEMLEFLPTMLATEEKAVIRELSKKFKKKGIKVHTSQMVLSVERTPEGGVRATTVPASTPKDQVDAAEKSVFEADLCLVSIGRAKVSSGLGLEELGVKIERGQVMVDRNTCETNVKGIYAIGDVTGGLMLAHVASYEGDIAVSHLLHDLGFDVKPLEARYDVIPYTIFVSPNIGSVGLREKAAKEKYDVYTGRFFYGSLGKAKCMGEEEGFMMIVAEAGTGKILGATCIGAEAPELISEVTVAMAYGIPAQELGKVIHSHPTISEMVMETAEDVHGMAIHKVGKPKKH